jgi:hypothetical protein
MLCRVLCVLLFVAWTGEWPLDRDPVLYTGLWRSPFSVFGPLFISMPEVELFPWQALVLAVAPFCLLRPGAFRNRAWALDAAVAVSLSSVALTFLWGWMRGGSAYQAYYQLWRFLLALLMGVMLHSVIRGKRDLRALGLTLLAAALVRGTLVIYFYWAVLPTLGGTIPSYMTTHDDSLLFVAAILVVVSRVITHGGALNALGAFLVSAHQMYAMVLNNRRLVWIELILALGLVYLLLPPRGWRRRVNRWLPVVAPLLLLYVVIGWGREEAIFEPVRAVSTAGSSSDSSSLARQEEIRNLLYTLSIAGNPLLGTGWGVAYSEATSVYTHFGGVGFWQYAYLPHNSLLGVAVFSGLVGLFGIWLVVPVSALLAMRGYLKATHPTDRAAALTALCILSPYGVQCYGDIGFQSLTCSLILAVAMATAARVSTRPRARASAEKVCEREQGILVPLAGGAG